MREPVGEVAEDAKPGAVVDSPVASEADDDGVGVRGDVDVLSVVPEGVEAAGPLGVDPPEVLVVVSRIGA